MELWTYCPEEVTILVMGAPLEGLVDGTFISVQRQSPVFTSKATADGRITRVYSAAEIWEIQFTMMNSSPSNYLLNNLVLLDKTTKRGKFPLMIKDGTGGTLIFSTSTWVEELPAVTFNTDVSERVWTLKSANAVVTIAGSGESSAVSDVLNTIAGSIPGLL